MVLRPIARPPDRKPDPGLMAMMMLQRPERRVAGAILQVLPVGDIALDGPATPEQAALYLPVTDTLPFTATATLRVKPALSGTWGEGHNLYRIRQAYTSVTLGYDAFAWTVIDLTPATAYDYEVTVTSGAVSTVRTGSFTTRALPAAAGAATTTITAGSSEAGIQAVLNSLSSGDVCLFENGTYVGSWNIPCVADDADPIIIRGESRAGVILQNSSRVFYILDAANVIIENMTIEGSGANPSPDPTTNLSTGIGFWNGGAQTAHRLTFRNLTITGVDVGISSRGYMSECLVYNCTLEGNNLWQASEVNNNSTWNDDGICLGGYANCAWQNTLSGFGDAFSCSPDEGVFSTSIHFWRNDVPFTCDDWYESDFGWRNLTFYDNRCLNSMTALSIDPILGGPLLYCRNISINSGRVLLKWNTSSSGQFIINNTFIRTTGKHWLDGNFGNEAGWYQPGGDSGSQNSYGFVNNILIYQGASGQLLRLDNGGHDPIDFHNNSYYPDGYVEFLGDVPGNGASLALAQAALGPTTPIFGAITQRLQNDNITVINPWTTTITLGTDYLTQITGDIVPILADGTAPRNSGAVIPGVTDGYSGAFPDRGAVIAGRGFVAYGDQS
jgi:hypothetical protein